MQTVITVGSNLGDYDFIISTDTEEQPLAFLADSSNPIDLFIPLIRLLLLSNLLPILATCYQ